MYLHSNLLQLNVHLMHSILVCAIFCVNASRGHTLADSWILFAREAKTVLQTCPRNDTTSSPQDLWSCWKSESLELFDRITALDIVPITKSIRLARYRNLDYNATGQHDTPGKSVKEIRESTWSKHILWKLVNLLSTHAIQVHFGETSKERARHRHRNQMLPMMLFGITALGMVMVPVGFQLLSILGGKALLMAKMALLLASINGLKRVASSGVHYGLYHTDPHYHQGMWERSDQFYSRPRALPNNP